MGILLMIHSIVRWLIVILALVAGIKFLLGWLQKKDFAKIDKQLLMGFSIAIDIQVTLGLILLVWGGLAGAGFPRERLEHAFMMILAMVMAHLPGKWKQAAGPVRFRNTFICIVLALVFIYLGVMVLPGGWSR